jgi:protein-L-isoaspartate O-methyltransferase
MRIFNKIFEHPLTRGLSVDDPRTTSLRRDIIKSKAFLHALYTEWYERIILALPQKNNVLELGSGAGFFQQFLPEVITSEVFETEGGLN